MTSQKSEYLLSFLISIIGCSALFIGVKISSPSINSSQAGQEKHGVAVIAAVAFLSSDAIKIIILLIGDHSYIQYHLEYLGRDGASQYLLIPAYILTFAKYYIYSLACGKSKSLFWAAFFLTLTVALFGRVRFEIISAIVFFAILGNYNKFLIISKYFAIILAVASPLIMYFLLIKRDYVGPLELSLIGAAIFSEVYEAWNSGRLFEGVRTSMESFYTFDIYNRVIMDGFISPDNGFFRLFYNLIPREYWPEKPLPMQIELAKAYNQSSYSNGGGVFASIYGDAYANAGFVGAGGMALGIGAGLAAAAPIVLTAAAIGAVAYGAYTLLGNNKTTTESTFRPHIDDPI
jgi:hypothetical protein